MDRGKPRLLLVSSTLGPELAWALSRLEVQVTLVPSLEPALLQLDGALFHSVWLAVDEGSSEAVARLAERCGDIPLVAFGPDTETSLRGALAAGAVEYMTWPASADALELTLSAALSRTSAATEPPGGAPVSGLLGSSPPMVALRDTLSRVASGTATALVRGETGTGKELVARAVHAQSARYQGPFVKVHAPAVPDALLESELFGYEKGAFTGASTRKPGRVELAEGGTLFLDEIGEVSPIMQAKLLRLIQDREYERLGGTKTLKADVRFVAATHRDLEHMVESGTFREDLFYRLNVVTLWMPPLRARRGDILLIAQHYLELFRAANHKPALELDHSAQLVLQSERWPGNVRQLVNFIERLVVLARTDVITGADVRAELDEQLAFLTQAAPLEAEAPALPPSPPPAEPALDAAPRPARDTHFSSAVRPLKEDLRRTEYRAITKALASAKGNRALAARLLGVSRRTLYTKLEEHGIE